LDILNEITHSNYYAVVNATFLLEAERENEE